MKNIIDINTSNYNYDSIKYFLSVAYHGSILRASHSLGISQAALSQSMKKLEESLDVKLFNRNTRGIILTETGKILYEKARIGDEYFRDAIIDTLRMKNSYSTKTFTIAATSSLFNKCLFPVFGKIIKKYRDVNFEFVNSVKENSIISELQNNKIDLIIKKTNTKFMLKEISSKTIMINNYYFTYNPTYYKFDKEITLEDLKDETIIIKLRNGSCDNSWMQASFNKIIICSSDENILDFTKQGLGIGLYPRELAIKNDLSILKVKDYKPFKRSVEAFYLEENEIAKDIVDLIIKNI